MTIAIPVILVVEDEMPLLQAIVLEAEKVGLQTVSTRSVTEAISMLGQVPTIDAVWLDHFVPEGTGLELVKFMRKDPQWKSTPIFLVTNVIDPKTVNQYMRAGIQGYYTKMLSSVHDTLTDIKTRLSLSANPPAIH